jgi:hypothetical protein
MPSNASFQSKAAMNRGLTCRVAGCYIPRKAISPFCSTHAKANERYGSPLGRAIRPKEYRVERQLVENFLAKHCEHEGVQNVIQWLRKWLDEANRGEEVPGRREIQRLASTGVTPLLILTEAAAVYLYSHWSPARSALHKLPDDERLTFAMGIRVLALAPRNRRYGKLRGKPRMVCEPLGKVDRRAVGQRIRMNAIGLLSNIARAIEADEDAKKQFINAQYKPFQ